MTGGSVYVVARNPEVLADRCKHVDRQCASLRRSTQSPWAFDEDDAVVADLPWCSHCKPRKPMRWVVAPRVPIRVVVPEALADGPRTTTEIREVLVARNASAQSKKRLLEILREFQGEGKVERLNLTTWKLNRMENAPPMVATLEGKSEASHVDGDVAEEVTPGA